MNTRGLEEKKLGSTVIQPSNVSLHNVIPDDCTYLTALFEAGLLIDTGVPGLYGRNKVFEDVVERVSALIGRWGQGKQVEVLRFPPAMSRTVLEESGHWRNFPEQIGAIFGFCGDDLNHQRLLKCLDRQEDWAEHLVPTRLTLTPVACLPVYPIMAARGNLPAQGRLIDIFSYCCRHEPSSDPERMLMFRQREFVCMGAPRDVLAFRDDWMRYAKTMFDVLCLPATLSSANDPFFGRGGKILVDSQRQQALKFEMLVDAVNPSKLTACGSFNYHRDRFSGIWGIYTEGGAVAHTGCCGFGLERIALGLFKVHGFDTGLWPPSARDTLWGVQHA